MNTKVKVGIAAAILAALVALVVLDHQTTPKDDVAAKPAPGTEAITVVGNGAAPPATRLGEEEINTLLQNAQKQFAQPKPPSSGPSIKSTEERNEKRIPSANGDEYVIKEGDTFETIAQKNLGSKTLAYLVAEANPDLKPTALRVGKTIKLPSKPEKREETVAAKPADPILTAPVVVEKKPSVETVGNQKIYTVQSGDTLSGISSRVYNTSRHYQKIYEANRDVIADPNTLQVGSKLVMPDLPAKSASPNGASAGTVATTNPAPVNAPAGAKVVQVGEGSSLWKIAEKFATEKKIGIHDMMKAIVAANPDKLKDEGTLLRLGWQLIIPE
jgi:nucleoid-associated protein YgaU